MYFENHGLILYKRQSRSISRVYVRQEESAIEKKNLKIEIDRGSLAGSNPHDIIHGHINSIKFSLLTSPLRHVGPMRHQFVILQPMRDHNIRGFWSTYLMVAYWSVLMIPLCSRQGEIMSKLRSAVSSSLLIHSSLKLFFICWFLQ